MLDADVRRRFEEWAASGRPEAEDFDMAAAAWMTHAAFFEPERQVAVFDALADAMGRPAAERTGRARAALEPVVAGGAARDIPRTLWDGFWAIAGETPTPPIDPVAFTLRVVALGTLYDEALIARCEAALLRHDNVRALLAMPERRMKTSDLEAYPPNALGGELLAMLRAQGYDLEVIDADTVVLPGPYPAQNRTNRLILQLHDVWHLLAGYGFTGAGEVAISGFQLAQFGQNYSTRFLATTATLAAFHLGPVAEMLLTVALDGWRHGRATPDLLARPWPELLGRDIPTLRNELGVRPFDSPVARMMEGMEAAAKAA